MQKMADETFGDFVKGVIDIRRGIMAIGAELHADEEGVLLRDGSNQQDLWGINLYPSEREGSMIEFDSMINIRPSQGNRSRTVEDAATRTRIVELVQQLITG